MGGILLTTINAKWIHPSLALRLLKANLGPLEERCDIAEFTLRQPLREMTETILSARPLILGISVSIWNHTATLELLRELRKIWESGVSADTVQAPDRPVIVLGGPEVSYLPPATEIFQYADHCVPGEGETAFRSLCEAILSDNTRGNDKNTGWITSFGSLEGEIVFSQQRENFSPDFFVNKDFQGEDLTAIRSAYHLYTGEDLRKKLIYAETSRGCPYACEF